MTVGEAWRQLDAMVTAEVIDDPEEILEFLILNYKTLRTGIRVPLEFDAWLALERDE